LTFQPIPQDPIEGANVVVLVIVWVITVWITTAHGMAMMVKTAQVETGGQVVAFHP